MSHVFSLEMRDETGWECEMGRDLTMRQLDRQRWEQDKVAGVERWAVLIGAVPDFEGSHDVVGAFR